MENWEEKRMKWKSFKEGKDNRNYEGERGGKECRGDL